MDGKVGIGTTSPGNTLTLGTAGNHSASFGIADVQTVTMVGDDNTTAPTCSNIEVKGSFTWTPAAGSLPDNSLVYVVNVDGSSPSVATYYQSAMAIHNAGFWMVRKLGQWYRLTP